MISKECGFIEAEKGQSANNYNIKAMIKNEKFHKSTETHINTKYTQKMRLIEISCENGDLQNRTEAR